MAEGKGKEKQGFDQFPVNVRIKHEDGTFTAMENVYGGYKDGLHHWYSVRNHDLKNADRIVWDKMPDDTRVHPYSPTAS